MDAGKYMKNYKRRLRREIELKEEMCSLFGSQEGMGKGKKEKSIPNRGRP